MDLSEYADSKRKKNPGVDALERWNSRIVAHGYDKRGIDGGNDYINNYGKSMGAPKCIALASVCDMMGAHETAMAFWQHAAYLEGVRLSGVGNMQKSESVLEKNGAIGHTETSISEYFPINMQPGSIAPMQPSDGKLDRKMYIENDEYWGQRKRDGNKVLVFAYPGGVKYQSRSTKLRSSWSTEFDEMMIRYANARGAFILEGELYYKDIDGGEHRTAPQAISASTEMGFPQYSPTFVYMPYVCLFRMDRDLRDTSYAVRIVEANAVARDIFNPMVEICETFRSTKEKLRLVKSQQQEGREGEIWFNASCTYISGKHRDERIIRTKYVDTLEYIVTRLSGTTGAGRLFGAIEVSDLTGKPVGNVGTGFDRATQARIVDRFSTSKELHIMVTHQGFTEDGQLWHARFEDFVEQA